jgi:hypothetical protein
LKLAPQGFTLIMKIKKLVLCHLFILRTITLFLFSISLPLRLSSQSVIYSQPFSGTLVASGWVSTSLTVPWGNQNLFGQNIWAVNDNESGFAANICGAGGGGDQSLHITHALISGAAYLADINANKRIASPVVSTVGYTGIVLAFDFIANGEDVQDRGYLQYSINGGTSWLNATGAPTTVNPALPAGSDLNNLKSQICGSGQGRWTHVTWNMPATCAGITNLRVGIVWQNNNNTSGTDPSFAIDDVSISGTITPMPIELLSFGATEKVDGTVQLDWTTATETNNDYFTIERSSDGSDFSEIAIADGAGNSSKVIDYSKTDPVPLKGLSYYRLKQTDFDQRFTYSNIVPFEKGGSGFELVNVYNDQGMLQITMNCSANCMFSVELYDLMGRRVFFSSQNSMGSNSKTSIPISDLNEGIYLFKVYNGDKMIVKKIKL